MRREDETLRIPHLKHFSSDDSNFRTPDAHPYRVLAGARDRPRPTVRHRGPCGGLTRRRRAADVVRSADDATALRYLSVARSADELQQAQSIPCYN